MSTSAADEDTDDRLIAEARRMILSPTSAHQQQRSQHPALPPYLMPSGGGAGGRDADASYGYRHGEEGGDGDDEEGGDASYYDDPNAASDYAHKRSVRLAAGPPRVLEKQSIAVDLLDLPLGLAVLFESASSVRLKRPCEELMHLLTVIATEAQEHRLQAEIAEHQLENDACYRLYVQATQTRERLGAKRDQIIKERLEKEAAACTFRPELSEAAKNSHRGGAGHVEPGDDRLVAFQKKGLEWLEKREKKLKEKGAKFLADEADDMAEEMKKLKMSARSLQLAERHRQRVAEKEELARIASGVFTVSSSTGAAASAALEGSPSPTHRSTNVNNNASSISSVGSPTLNTSSAAAMALRAELLQWSSSSKRRTVSNDRTDMHLHPTFEPITNEQRYAAAGMIRTAVSAADHRHESLLSLAAGGADNDASITDNTRVGGADGDAADENGGNGGDETGRLSQQKAAPGQRLFDDAAQRKERHAQLLAEHDLRMREKLFDPVTGQPFFTPNAMPTILVGRKRMALHELPPADRIEALKVLKQKHMDFLIAVAKKREEQMESGGAFGGGKQRDISDFLKYCDEMQDKAQKRVEKLRRLEEKELEGLFHPKVNQNSSKMLQGRGTEKVYDRELPRKEAPPPPPPKKVSDAIAINKMLERSSTWCDRRTHQITKKHHEIIKEETSECSFSPKIRRQVSDRLAAAAENRLLGELAVLRSQSEQLKQADMEAEQAAAARQQSKARGTSVASSATASSLGAIHHHVSHSARPRQGSTVNYGGLLPPQATTTAAGTAAFASAQHEPEPYHDVINETSLTVSGHHREDSIASSAAAADGGAALEPRHHLHQQQQDRNLQQPNHFTGSTAPSTTNTNNMGWPSPPPRIHQQQQQPSTSATMSPSPINASSITDPRRGLVSATPPMPAARTNTNCDQPGAARGEDRSGGGDPHESILASLQELDDQIDALLGL